MLWPIGHKYKIPFQTPLCAAQARARAHGPKKDLLQPQETRFSEILFQESHIPQTTDLQRLWHKETVTGDNKAGIYKQVPPRQMDNTFSSGPAFGWLFLGVIALVQVNRMGSSLPFTLKFTWQKSYLKTWEWKNFKVTETRVWDKRLLHLLKLPFLIWDISFLWTA